MCEGSGRPLMNRPPSWFTRPCPEDNKEEGVVRDGWVVEKLVKAFKVELKLFGRPGRVGKGGRFVGLMF